MIASHCCCRQPHWLDEVTELMPPGIVYRPVEELYVNALVSHFWADSAAGKQKAAVISNAVFITRQSIVFIEDAFLDPTPSEFAIPNVQRLLDVPIFCSACNMDQHSLAGSQLLVSSAV